MIANADTGAVPPLTDTSTAATFAAAKTTVDAVYATATALHFQIEPLNALAFQKDGKREIHTGKAGARNGRYLAAESGEGSCTLGMTPEWSDMGVVRGRATRLCRNLLRSRSSRPRASRALDR